MKEKGFYFIGSNYLKNNAFFVSDKFQKNIYFKKLKIDLSSLNIDSNFRESRDTNGNLNYLSKDKALVNIYDCEVVDISENNFKIKKVRDYYGNKKSKPVDMLNEITKEYIRTFPSAKEAAKFIGKESSSSEINNCCNKKVMKNGKIKESFGGYRWRRSEINFKLNVK